MATEIGETGAAAKTLDSLVFTSSAAAATTPLSSFASAAERPTQPSVRTFYNEENQHLLIASGTPNVAQPADQMKCDDYSVQALAVDLSSGQPEDKEKDLRDKLALMNESEWTKVMQFLHSFRLAIRFLTEAYSLCAEVQPVIDQFSNLVTPEILSAKRLADWFNQASNNDIARSGFTDRKEALNRIYRFINCYEATMKTQAALSNLKSAVIKVKGRFRDGSVLQHDDLVAKIDQQFNQPSFRSICTNRNVDKLLPIIRLQSDFKDCSSTSFRELAELSQEYHSLKSSTLPSEDDCLRLQTAIDSLLGASS